MEENDCNLVRLRLVFDDRLLHKSQRSQGLRCCWFLLKPEITSIGDLASQIRECFGLRHRIVLLMDDFVLPSFESTCIITDKDIIRVKKKEAKQKDICKPSDGQKNLLQNFENARMHDLTSCMENSIHLDPPGDVGSTKQKRKRSKKLVDLKGQYDEINHENEFGPSNNSDVRKKSLLIDERSNIKEQDRNKENAIPQTTDNDQCFKVDGAPVSDGILPLPKPEVMSSAVNITKPYKHVIHFEILLPLCRLPVKGDILAYRFVEPSSSVYLELSSPQVGMVSSFDYNTLQIILLPVLDYVFLLDENSHGTIVQPNASRYKEDGSLEIEYLSLVDVRLVKDHGLPEKERTCQDDQTRNVNWEKALVKGSWNEPNASIAGWMELNFWWLLPLPCSF